EVSHHSQIGEYLQLLGYHYGRNESKLPDVYAQIAQVPAAVALRWARVLEASGATQKSAGGLALWRLGLAWAEPLAGLVAAVIYLAFPLLIITIGGESSLVLALVLWAFVAAAAERWRVVAILLALATILRADTALVVLVLGLIVLVRCLRRRSGWAEIPWDAVAIYGLILVPWLIFAQLYFGSPVPVTLAAKRYQAQIAESHSFGQGLIGWFEELWKRPGYQVLLVLAALGLSYCVLRRRAAGGVLSWSVLYSLAYTLLGVTSYFWYYSPVYLGLIAAAGLGLAGLVAGLRRLLPIRVVNALVLVLVTLVLATEINDLVIVAASPDPRLGLYRQVGVWLHDHTPSNATVGSVEVGVIGYYSQRPIIDFAGLIQPETAMQFDAQHGYSAVARWAMDRYQPAYLVLQETTLPLLQGSPDLAARCLAQAEFPDPRFPNPIVIYHCDWDVSVVLP
ncbi:MAG: hypothetical protein HGA19_13720, partial [Oscillochloris sp.]|nr:hypothetical protein [Oscillochloris sp.]